MEHINWWNSLTIERRDKLSQTYFQSEKSLVLSNVEILHIYEKINRHETFVNVKEMYKGKVNKLPKLKGNEKFKQIRDDIRTTILGLCQLLIYQLDQLGEDKSIFSQGLKSAGKLLAKELEKNMNLYFKLNKEEQFTQADLLNLLCNSIEHNIKLAYRAAEMDEETCNLFLADYKELMNKYGIENDFLNETTNKNESN